MVMLQCITDPQRCRALSAGFVTPFYIDCPKKRSSDLILFISQEPEQERLSY